MTIYEAVVQRILQLCEQQNISISHLCTLSTLPPSTIYSVINFKSKNVRLDTLQKLCNGLNLSLIDFFNSDLFDDLEQEIK